MLFGMRRCRISLPNRCYLLISRVAHRALNWTETDPTERTFYKAFRDFNPLNDIGIE